MHELVAGLPLVTALAVACLSVPLWLTARPLSACRRVMSLVCPASQVAVVALTYAAARVGLIMEASALAVAALSLVCVALDVRVVRALVEAEGADAARQRVQAAQEQLSAQREHLRTLARAQGEASELRGRTAGMFAAVAAALARGERDRALEMLREGEELAASPVRSPARTPSPRRCSQPRPRAATRWASPGGAAASFPSAWASRARSPALCSQTCWTTRSRRLARAGARGPSSARSSA